MINNRKIIALIPARGGSKGIKNKNIVSLLGKPLIVYTIDAAKESRYIDSVVVTTDSEEIAFVAKEAGASVPFLRPQELATDHAKTIDAVLHAIKWLEDNGNFFDILVLLQPTQPLRQALDIDKAIELFENSSECPLVSVCEVDDNPILMRTIGNDGKLNNLLRMGSTIRRQDMPVYYKVNGAIYINLFSEIDEETSFNDNRVPFIMDKTRSIDIDDMDDLEMARIFLRRGNKA